nr:DUF732 domain-containing protein [Corynebacterium lactis]
MRRSLALASAALLAFGIAACGGSTVDSADVTTSAKSSSTSAASTSQSEEKSKQRGTSRQDPEINEPGAKRVDEAPDGHMPLSDADGAYLDDLIAAKVDVQGVEDQLIGAGRATCADTPEADRKAMADAMAGQLIAQGRTKAEASAVSSAIAKAAKKAYC